MSAPAAGPHRVPAMTRPDELGVIGRASEDSRAGRDAPQSSADALAQADADTLAAPDVHGQAHSTGVAGAIDDASGPAARGNRSEGRDPTATDHALTHGAAATAAPSGPLAIAATQAARGPLAPAWALRTLVVVACVALLPLAKPFLLPVVLAVLLAIVLSGPVRALQRSGVAEPVGAALVVSTLLLVVGAVLLALSEPASEWLRRAPSTMAQWTESLERLREAFPLLHAATGGAAASAGAGPGEMATESSAISDTLKTEGLTLTRLVFEQAAGFAVAAVATVILLYFLLASENWFVIRLMQRVRSRHARLHGLAMGRCAQRDIAHFLLTMLLINVVLGAATAAALWAIGLSDPLLWGTVTAVLNFVPYLGPLVIMAMLLMAGILTYDSFGMMVAPPLLFLALNAAETYLLSPLIVGRRLDLNPVFVFLSVMFWGWAWGVAGTLVAVPLLLAIRHACRHSRSLRPVAAWLERPGDTGNTIKALVRNEPRPRWWPRRHRDERNAAAPAARSPPGRRPRC